MYLKVIQDLRSTRSGTEKGRILSRETDNIVLQEILSYTYHPFKHYYISRIPNTWKGQGTETLETLLVEWTSSLERLASRDISGYAGRSLVQEIITSLTPSNAELFKCIVKKDLRAGLGITSINKAIPNLIPHFSVNLAQAYTGWTGPKWVSLKIDGLRGRFKNGEFFTRNGHKIYGLDHLISQIPSSITDLDGELDLPEIGFDVASGRIRAHAPTKGCTYKVFGYPKGNLSFAQRYQILKDQLSICGPDINLVKHILVRSQAKIDTLFSQAIAAGFEGLVLNEPDDFYVEKRSKNMLKLKDTDTIDLRIIELAPGEPGKQYEHSLGAFICQLPNGRTVRVGQGNQRSLSNERRTRIWLNQDKWIGRTIEILYHKKTDKGSLRHPRFIRTRDDKG